MNKNKKAAAFAIIAMAALTVTGCHKETSSKGGTIVGKYDNETTPLVFSSAEVDGVFNPFFSTNAADSNIVGMTQIGMIGNDKDGNPVWGEDEPVIVLDYEQQTRAATTSDGATESQVTEYKFVLKNDIKFSNGSPLTMKDVLFNLYVYLDPVYTGSTTIYSTDIVGLKRYRTQVESPQEQEAFKQKFQIEASQRIQSLVDAANDVFDADKNHGSWTISEFKTKLAAATSGNSSYANVIADFDKACELFKEELNSDYTNAVDSYGDISFKLDDGTVLKPFTTDVEAFLYNEGYISFNKKDQKIESSLANDYTTLRSWTKEQAVDAIYNSKLPESIEEVVTYWNTAVTLNDFLVSEAMSNYFAGSGKIKYRSIDGIKFANREGSVTVNGKNYTKPTYNDDGSVRDGNEVLSILINGVDPKAIWNFSLGIAPMYYYSDAEHIAKFDYEKNFGVEYMSQDFMDKVVKNPSKIGVPMGAGAYQPSKSAGGIDNITSGQFKDKGVIYFERNDYFLMGKPKIKKVRFQIVPESRMMDSLQSGAVDFVEPQAKVETINDLKGMKDKGIGYSTIGAAGYGYIGINAGKIPDVEVRRAIMHAININETVSYYGGTANPIYRSMSLYNWAYPEDCKPGGKNAKQYYAYDNTGATSEKLVKAANYTKGSDGIYQKDGKKLKFTFTIAGAETDHPAWQALYHAAEVLNKVGFDITVTNDTNALKKLSTGNLEVWAAAWGSTIDPDMYQVYHIDSTATSVLNWGYKQIKANTGDKYAYELATIEDLSYNYIEKARETTDTEQRKNLYSQALEIVMDLAVELPTYQRDDLFAYNSDKIDETTLTPESDRSPYNGLTSRIWEVSLRTGK